MDVAALALAIDSTDVVKAAADLDRFAASATKAGNAAKPGSIARMAQDYARVIDKVGQYAGAAARAAAANDNVTRAANGAAVSQARIASEAAKAGQAFAAADAHVAAYRQHLQGLVGASGAASAGIRSTAVAAKDSAGAIKASTGNIAAQFQDIGVTATMGMSPLIIGLQQGTQLAAVFAQSGGSMGSALAGAFRQIASAQAIMTIGLVAAAAALIQLVDWGELARKALNGLADILPTIAPYAVAAAAGLALLYSPAIIAGLWSLVTGFVSLAASIAATVGLPVLVVAGLVAIVAAAVAFRDQLTRYLGFDIVGAAQKGVNMIIGAFVGGFNGIKNTWRTLPAVLGDAVYSSVNLTTTAIEKMINMSINGINALIRMLPDWVTSRTGTLGGVSLGRVDNPFAGAGSRMLGTFASEINAAQKVDWVGKGISGIQAGAEWAAGKLRGLAAGIGQSADKAKGATGAGGSAEADTFERARNALSLMQSSGKAVGSAINEIVEATEKRAKAFQGIVDRSNDAIGQLELELSLFGKTAQEADRARIMYDMLAEAKRNVGVLTQAEIAQLGQAADRQAALNASLEKMRELESVKIRGLDSLNDGIVDAIRGVKTLGDAFSDVANQIIADLLRIAVRRSIIEPLANLLFGVGAAASGGAGGAAASLITSLFANGGAFGTVQRFANGGAFTNQIFSQPTLFRFANGGKVGMMGEEGPEAVMPLTRGPNGKLGVQAHGGGGRLSPSVTINTPITIAQSGSFTTEDARAMAVRAGQAAVEEVRRSLQSYLAELDANGILSAY